jgi:hypothetical protein
LKRATRSKLLKVTNIYASSWRDPKLSKSLRTICKKISDWREDTDRLRIAIWEKSTDQTSREKLERSKLIKKIANEDIDLDDIIGRHFNQISSKIESIYPPARFDRLLKGSIAISDYIVERIIQDAVLNPEARLWFLWAATVFAILREADIPVKNPDRERLLTGPVKVLEKLQSKLPEELKRRQKETSLRKGAVNAYKMRTGNNVALMQWFLTRWANGNFSTEFPGHPMSSGEKFRFLKRFDAQMARATKHQQSRRKLRGTSAV